MRYFYKEKACFSIISSIFNNCWEIIETEAADHSKRTERVQSKDSISGGFKINENSSIY